MTSRNSSLELCVPLAIAWLAVAARAQSEAPALAVIVHPDNPVRELTLTQLRAYFQLDYKTWEGGTAAVLYLRPSGSTEMKILRKWVYGKSAIALRKWWENQEYQGKINLKPAEIRTSAAAIRRIRANSGAFTAILAKDLPESGVRVVKIDGKLPGEKGYPLIGSEPDPDV